MGVLIEGHPVPAYNGVYRVESEHEGWPVLKNDKGEHGAYFYRAEGGFWRLKYGLNVEDGVPDFRADGPHNASIYAPEGRFPVGEHTWECWVFFGLERDFEWHPLTLTVTLQ